MMDISSICFLANVTSLGCTHCIQSIQIQMSGKLILQSIISMNISTTGSTTYALQIPLISSKDLNKETKLGSEATALEIRRRPD